MPPRFRVLSQFHSASLLLCSAEIDRFLPHLSLSFYSPFKCSLTPLLFSLIAMTLLSLLLFFPYFGLIFSFLPPPPLSFPLSPSLWPIFQQQPVKTSGLPHTRYRRHDSPAGQKKEEEGGRCGDARERGEWWVKTRRRLDEAIWGEMIRRQKKGLKARSE